MFLYDIFTHSIINFINFLRVKGSRFSWLNHFVTGNTWCLLGLDSPKGQPTLVLHLEVSLLPFKCCINCHSRVILHKSLADSGFSLTLKSWKVFVLKNHVETFFYSNLLFSYILWSRSCRFRWDTERLSLHEHDEILCVHSMHLNILWLWNLFIPVFVGTS